MKAGCLAVGLLCTCASFPETQACYVKAWLKPNLDKIRKTVITLLGSLTNLDDLKEARKGFSLLYCL